MFARLSRIVYVSQKGHGEGKGQGQSQSWIPKDLQHAQPFTMKVRKVRVTAHLSTIFVSGNYICLARSGILDFYD